MKKELFIDMLIDVFCFVASDPSIAPAKPNTEPDVKPEPVTKPGLKPWSPPKPKISPRPKA